MNPYIIIAVASSLISLVTLIFVIFGHRHKIGIDLVAQLEMRVAALERELKTAQAHIQSLEQHNDQLMKENINLLRRVALMENGE